jgi:spore germination protein GerM
MTRFLRFGHRGQRKQFFYLTIAALTAVAFSAMGCAEHDTVKNEKAVYNVDVYFNNDELSDDLTNCAAVFPVSRTVDTTQKPEKAALMSLFQGPSTEERKAGYRSFFSSATKDLLNSVWVQDGVAYVDLSDKRGFLSGATSSCGSAEFHSQIEHTLFQFSSIKRVIYAIDGDAKVFYAWMNETCDETNNHCNFPTTSPEG